MTAIIASIPILVFGALSIFTRASAFQAACAGITAALLVGSVLPEGLTLPAIVGLIPDLAILTLSVVAVVVPGLIFVNATSAAGSTAALTEWVNAWPASLGMKVALVVVGIAPALESLTGFGVSLVITVPVMLALLERKDALPVSLISMNIMPWGTLGLATLVGAKLAGMEADLLGYRTALVSAGVFPLASCVAVWVTGRRNAAMLVQAGAVGMLFSACLIATNAYLGVEIAGAAAGLATFVLMMALLRLIGIRLPLPPREAWPYALLIGLVGVARLLVRFSGDWTTEFNFSSGDLDWNPISSPGLPLLIAAVVVGIGGSEAKGALGKAVKPCLSIFALLVLAQTMIHTGQIEAIAAEFGFMNQYGGPALFSPFGALSGYLTGSNVGANALLMPTAAGLDMKGGGVGFAAIQNSAAGHAVLASVPIVMLVLGLSGSKSPEEESRLIRFGAIMAVANTLVIALCSVYWF